CLDLHNVDRSRPSPNDQCYEPPRPIAKVETECCSIPIGGSSSHRRACPSARRRESTRLPRAPSGMEVRVAEITFRASRTRPIVLPRHGARCDPPLHPTRRLVMRLPARPFPPPPYAARSASQCRVAASARSLGRALAFLVPLVGSAPHVRGPARSTAADLDAQSSTARVHAEVQQALPDVGDGTEVLPPPLRSLFFGTIEDDAPPERGGVTEARKNKQYLTGNEKSLFAFHAAIAGLGGGYVGVGSDQAYLFIGWARPQLAWLTDYDPDVVRIHRVHRAFFLAFADPEAFLAAWSKEGTAQARAALAAHCDAEELETLERLYFRNRIY